ncbi:MarR family winged helix-turn-helix transcriptional regulator [Roseobacter fucihabitans]|uniref:MarR family winged helix-turn-helix transcriptional regulator n=1 Tax=Roseobacter fucihabitans TaxID=1537242 RepID=UPI001652E3FD|nr:MarR family transcriptional regulator [Roseobacter litoralis]
MKKAATTKSDIATAILLEAMVRDAYRSKVSADVHPLQWSVLRYLGTHPQSQCTMSLMRKSLRKTHAPVVRAIQTLVKRDLVRQIANPEDARSRFLLLTPSGAKTLSRDPILGIVRRFEILPPSQLRVFKNAVHAMASLQDPGI